MQDSPNKETMLLAVAKFLGTEVRPLVKDPKVSFRLLIAAHLCATVASECDGEEAQDRAELGRLVSLLADVPHAEPGSASRKAIAKGNAELARAIRDGAVPIDASSPAFAHIKATLVEKLAINSPRFDTRADIESGN
jgi:hypothetical protein